jgi:hypothetical protein
MASDSDKNLRFGFRHPIELAAKGRRELKRLERANVENNTEEAADYAMNAALTISHLVDWTFWTACSKELLTPGDWSSFASAARKADDCTAILTDISNSTKHFQLTQKPKSNASCVIAGSIVYVDEFLVSPFKSPTVPLGGQMRARRTIIDDDEIIGFETIVDGHRIESSSGSMLFENICLRALDFWDIAISEVDRGKLPPWFS